jgi:hypothetical protein
MSAAALLGAASPAGIPSLQGGASGDSESSGTSESDGLAATNITLGGSFAVGGNSTAKTGDVGGGQSVDSAKNDPASISGIPQFTNFATFGLIGLGIVTFGVIAWRMRG